MENFITKIEQENTIFIILDFVKQEIHFPHKLICRAITEQSLEPL